MNQVALFFEESGQPFYWALGLQSGPKNKLKQRKRAPAPAPCHATRRQTKSKTAEDGRPNSALNG